MSIAICTIVKDEAKNLDEWIKYYLNLGVDNIYIYDNESEDEILSILAKYPQVEYFFIKGKCRQLSANNHCLQNFGDKHDWIGFLDMDEFLVPISDTIQNILEKYKDYGGLGINWAVYGSSGHDSRPKGNVKDNYLYRAEKDFEVNKHIKSFVQPSRVESYVNPHFAQYKSGYYCVDEKLRVVPQAWTESVTWDTIRINHYHCKSKEDYKEKIRKGRVDTENAVYDMSTFINHDHNDVYDDILKGK